MVDGKAQAVFEEQMRDPANRLCCDSGADKPEWASVSHGIYISIGASGVHRSLGVKVSYVQSMSMDSWKPVHLRMMEIGGNDRFNKFMLEHNVPADMPIREKYSTKAAKWYREALRAEAEGLPLPAPLEPGEGLLPSEGVQSSEGQLLDQVFARVPEQRSMTAGGVPVKSSKARKILSRSQTSKSGWRASWAAKSLAFFLAGRSSDAAVAAGGSSIDMSGDSSSAVSISSTAGKPSESCAEACRGHAARHLAAAHLGAFAVA
mmetsp:Transcript_17530/g.30683  ORF Transcript_17530/g.30683 Transcript_17530/m.30683 type:complete len:262 (+) Transcript_17530:88-873(+)